MFNLELQLESLYKGESLQDLRVISSRVITSMLSRGVGTISRTIRVPNIDGIKMRGLYAMLEREYKQHGIRGVLYDSSALILMDDKELHGIIRIDRMQRIYNINYSGTRAAYLALLRNQTLRELVRSDRSPGVYKTRINANKGAVDGVITTIGDVTPPTNWDAAYPFLMGEKPEEVADPAKYWELWDQSDCNLTLLIGDPGTGKSTWMRGVMDARGYRRNIPRVVDDMEILTHPSFNTYIADTPDGAMFVIEDADLYVAKREDGNSKMSALLNAISGITKSNIKFMIATNLSSLRQVDPALYRPGRAFRVMEFGKLTAEQATLARETYDLPAVDFAPGSYTLAEIINHEGLHAVAPKTGFVK